MAYTVKAHSGYYGEEMDWDVVNYFSKDDAQAHADQANAWAFAKGVKSGSYNPDNFKKLSKAGENNPWDLPKVIIGGFYKGGVSFYIEEIQIRKKL